MDNKNEVVKNETFSSEVRRIVNQSKFELAKKLHNNDVMFLLQKLNKIVNKN